MEYPDSSPLTKLRLETAERHRSLEDSLDLLRPDFNRSSYIAVLQNFYGFWRPWEREIGRALAPDFSQFAANRKRVPALCSDLAHLGFSAETIAGLSCATRIPELSSVDAALGSMYVSEGSTLGGQLLTQHFVQTVGIRTDECAFFSGYGPKTGSMWKLFGSELAKRPEAAYPVMVEAANQTFDRLYEWLNS